MTDNYRLEQAIAWHLANNFIPPQPIELTDYCIKAIDACNNNDPDRAISLPGGVIVTAGDLVNDLRLEDMVKAN
jgi:hypothetical protein